MPGRRSAARGREGRRGRAAARLLRRPHRRHYRLFCALEREGADLGLGGPSIVLITGMDKPFRTVLSANDYAAVRVLADEYRARVPRSVSR